MYIYINIYKCTYNYICANLSLSLYIYIYIHTYIIFDILILLKTVV